MNKLTRVEMQRRMVGVGAVAVLAIVTFMVAGDVLHDDEAELVSWTGFWIAATLAGIVTLIYAYRQQVRQSESGTSAEPSPVPIALGIAVGILTFMWIRGGDPYQQLAMVGAMFGFWVGAGIGTAAALVPRLANAPIDEVDASTG